MDNLATMQVLAKENPQHIYFYRCPNWIFATNRPYAFVTENEIDVIVNCAAYTAVDNAEDNRELCDKLNHVSDICACRAKPWCRYYTGFYGLLPMEQLTSLTMKTNLLVRLPYMVSPSWRESRLPKMREGGYNPYSTWLYSIYGNNFVKTMMHWDVSVTILGLFSTKWERRLMPTIRICHLCYIINKGSAQNLSFQR